MKLDTGEERMMLRKISRGDSLAFTVVYNSYKNKVYGYAINILQSEFAAEEIVQEVFLSIWINRTLLTTVESFEPYLRVIVKNKSLNALKKALAEKRKHFHVNFGKSDSDHSTENHLQYKETSKLMDLAIASLTNQQRIVYTMCHINGFRQKDVAQKLQISPLTVKVHLREAVKSIRAFLNSRNSASSITLIISIIKLLF